jgi:hypothetical protein
MRVPRRHAIESTSQAPFAPAAAGGLGPSQTIVATLFDHAAAGNIQAASLALAGNSFCHVRVAGVSIG